MNVVVLALSPLLFWLGVCAAQTPPVQSAAEKVSVEDYVLLAIDKLQANHVNRGRVDWDEIRGNAVAKARQSASYDEAHSIVRGVIDRLGESHTFLLSPRAPPTGPVTAGPQRPIEPHTAQVGLAGYVLIPTFALTERDKGEAFARTLRKALAAMSQKQTVCGWIVDLRSNEGGNMAPALLGLGPLLGEGMLAGVDSHVIPQYWHYSNNRFLISNSSSLVGIGELDEDPGSATVRGVREILRLDPDAPSFETNLPVAVLIGRYTASSGEGIAVALLGRGNVRSFGTRTRGLTSGNIGVRLPDGAMLAITVGHFTDRMGRSYPSGIEPIEAMASQGFSVGLPPEADPVVVRAAAWIEENPNCRSVPRK